MSWRIHNHQRLAMMKLNVVDSNIDLTESKCQALCGLNRHDRRMFFPDHEVSFGEPELWLIRVGSIFENHVFKAYYSKSGERTTVFNLRQLESDCSLNGIGGQLQNWNRIIHAVEQVCDQDNKAADFQHLNLFVEDQKSPMFSDADDFIPNESDDIVYE